jgi:hypothetical protein
MRSCAMPPDDPAHSARGASHGVRTGRVRLQTGKPSYVRGPVPDRDHGDRQRARARAECCAGGLNHCPSAIKYVRDPASVVAFSECAEADALDG